MKKYFLFILCYLLIAPVFGQKFDKNLIYGHWKAYYVSNSQFTVNTDTLKLTRLLMLNGVALSSSNQLSYEDSLMIAPKFHKISVQLDSSYMEFSKDGKYVAMLYFAGNDSTPPQKTGGTYKWIDDRKIAIKSEEDTEMLSVITLTSKRLAIVVEDKEGNPSKGLKLAFKKE